MENNKDKWILNADNTLLPTGDIKTYKLSDFVFDNKKICIRCVKRIVEDNLDYCSKCQADIEKIEHKDEEQEEYAEKYENKELEGDDMKKIDVDEERDERKPEDDDDEGDMNIYEDDY